jgi:hypothetical protein
MNTKFIAVLATAGVLLYENGINDTSVLIISVIWVGWYFSKNNKNK